MRNIATAIVDGLKQANPWPAFQQLESHVRAALFGDANHPESPFKGQEPATVVRQILDSADPIGDVEKLLTLPPLGDLAAGGRGLLKLVGLGSEPGSHFSVVTALLGALTGAEKLISGLNLPVAKITIEAHVRTTVEVPGFPPFIIQEDPSAWASSDGKHDVTVGVPHFGFDNGNTPSLAKAAGDLVEVVKKQAAAGASFIPTT